MGGPRFGAIAEGSRTVRRAVTQASPGHHLGRDGVCREGGGHAANYRAPARITQTSLRSERLAVDVTYNFLYTPPWPKDLRWVGRSLEDIR